MAECITEDDQNIQFVEYKAFNRLINYLEPRSRHYMNDKGHKGARTCAAGLERS